MTPGNIPPSSGCARRCVAAARSPATRRIPDRHARPVDDLVRKHSLGEGVARRGDRESHCIPPALRWRPAATAGVSQVAECFQNILRRKFAFMAGGRAMTAPSKSQRKPRRMRPVSIFQFRHRHEIGAGQFTRSRIQELLGLAIVISWRRSGQFRYLGRKFLAAGFAPSVALRGLFRSPCRSARDSLRLRTEQAFAPPKKTTLGISPQAIPACAARS